MWSQRGARCGSAGPQLAIVGQSDKHSTISPFEAAFSDQKYSLRGAKRSQAIDNLLFHSVGPRFAQLYNSLDIRMLIAGQVDGAGAQEENFHRRSDAARWTIWQAMDHYPIPSSACLVSDPVTVFRGSEKDGYPYLAEPFKVDCLLPMPQGHIDYLICG